MGYERIFTIMQHTKSKQAYEHAKRFFPGGVNSPVRAFGSVGGTPPFILKAQGSHLWDIDGNEYIDYVGSWGPAILGHAHPNVSAVLTHAVTTGTSFGAPTLLETELAELITQALPSMEMLRFVNSGTEATMSALRLARGVTKRKKILKFEGCYHGHADSLLVKAGSGAATYGESTSAGVPDMLAHETIVCSYNDLERVTTIMTEMGNEIAAIIVEPVVGNMGCVLPASGFLKGLRDLTTKHGTLLIFDEVMTGFRVGFTGAQGKYGITPDLTCLGKIIGGGLPVGAYGGKRQFMEQIAPLGAVYQAGTLSGNPLAMSAGIETLKLLSHPETYTTLEEKTVKLTSEISRVLTQADIAHQISQCGSMWTLFFTKNPVIDFDSASKGNNDRFKRFFHAMLDEGIYLPPSPYEAAFMSLAHTQSDIEKTLEAVQKWISHESK
ncbi:MAG: glutamate-1-semialdehyde-2,1-aminomutase [Deltaproteobacteria bacterium RIFCSPLOWO2_02_FULL_44_10]|nr:MAG: glutamate-1-semialdehyde-2,1-aminomutase [Deltaproteobacteria bacterium RIFCSPHIGHO2_02_FULL_44_16]OGQ46538.1 MAG: glutamate-1-semialdehyde-2,1-aminomutase [Deltaproteobacteria bacterium RIFCSPLOWO2_02_FULL_44_10]